MKLFGHAEGRFRLLRIFPVLFLTLFFTTALGFNTLWAGTSHPETFASPEEAFRALVEAIRTADRSQWVALFGPSGKELFGEDQRSGPLTDLFLKDYEERHRVEEIGRNRVVLHVGQADWPWPIPLVKKGSRWRFDVKQGRREILARRIGRNETAAVQVCLAYVDAQHEYAAAHRTTEGMDEYAQKFLSDPGKENGLCWIPGKEESPSPVGPLLARACQTNGAGLQGRENSMPYHGYYYKILTGQSQEARGGAYSYLLQGRMVGGFGLVAYPAVYGHSAIMTFIVNQDGQIYEKDLGPKTEKMARSMEIFNPDKTWKKVD
jgi:hypothetical protein